MKHIKYLEEAFDEAKTKATKDEALQFLWIALSPNTITEEEVEAMQWHYSDEPPKNVVLQGNPEHWEMLLNARQFISDQLKKHPNIKITDAGVCGEYADLGILIEDCPFWLTIKFRDK